MGKHNCQKPFVKKATTCAPPSLRLFELFLQPILLPQPQMVVTSCYIYLLIPIPHLLIGSARVIANLPSGTARGKQLIFQIVENCLLVYVIQLVSNSSECRGHRLTLLEKPQVKPASLVYQKSIYGNSPKENIFYKL
jgi:hypothetical protein